MGKKFVRKLLAKSPAAGLCPVEFDGLKLVELSFPYLFAISPYPKNEKKCSAVLKKNHGIHIPNVRRATGRSHKKAIWFGNFTLFIGEEPNIALSEVAAVVDQSDAWCSLRLTGKNAEEVMQRLCPIDVRLSVFKTGCVAKTMLGLMPVTLHRSGKDQFDIYGFRSMSRTLVSEITESIKKTMYLVKQK
jgi:sarcosine oxidase subunit gamma